MNLKHPKFLLTLDPARDWIQMWDQRKILRKEVSAITRNQIEYWNLQENKRHNITTETETKRHNVAGEGIDIGRLQETKRHNLVTEDISYRDLEERRRHNLRTEGQTDVSLGIQAGSLAEQKRHNLSTEGLTGVNLNILAGQLGEQIRHNQATEGLTALRYDSQNRLDNARAQLTEIQSEWENIRQSLSADLTQTQIDQIDAQIDKYQVEVDKLYSDIMRNNFQNINSVTRSISDLSSVFKDVAGGASSIASILALLGG